MNSPPHRPGLPILLGSTLLLAMVRPVRADETDPVDDYAKARLQAMETGQPLVVLAGAPWCRPCLQIEDLIPRLRNEGVFVHLDVGKHPDLVRLLGISQIPTLIIWRKDRQGWMTTRAVGPAAIRKLLEPPPPAKTRGNASASSFPEEAPAPSVAGSRASDGRAWKSGSPPANPEEISSDSFRATTDRMAAPAKTRPGGPRQE